MSQRLQYFNYIDYIKKKKLGIDEDRNCANIFNVALEKRDSNPEKAVELFKAILKKDKHDVEAKNQLQLLKGNNSSC